MIHEIRPGDVVIVTMDDSISDKLADMIIDSVKGMGAAHCIIGMIPECTNPSVHILRKAEEAKGEPGWPAWRDVKVEKPPIGVPVLVLEQFGDTPVILTAWYDGEFYKAKTPRRTVLVTHWMPMPEGPKV